MIKQYDEMLHKNWDLSTEEQRARIEQIRANTARMSGGDGDEALDRLDQILKEVRDSAVEQEAE